MREFVFALEYDPGANPVADVLEASPETTVRSLSCHVTSDRLWRVDLAEGPELSTLEAAYDDRTYCADCLVTDDCGADCETQVLDRTEGALVIYTSWERTDVCTSVPHLALEHLGEGLLFETRRERRRYRWRIVLPGSEPVGPFVDALEGAVRDCAGMELLRLTELDPGAERRPEGPLPPEQRAALRAAVERGYYETPRWIDLSGLAEELGVPRSTLSYRLRRAEAELATAFVGDDSLEELSPGL